MSKKQSSPSSQVQKEDPTKEITKKEETKPTKKYSVEDAKNYILNSLTTADLKSALEKFSNNYLGKIYAGDVQKEQESEIIAEITKISDTLGVETGFSLMNSVGDENYGLALEAKRNLQKEFNCQSYSEKMLVDLAIGSYVSKLHYERLLRLNQKNAGSNYNGYRNSVSKEIDRAHRQFISAIETLKIMKQPTLKVNVRTNNAFIGEQQHFNNNAENNESK